MKNTHNEYQSAYFILLKYLNQNNFNEQDFFKINRFTNREADKIKETFPLNHQLIYKLAKATKCKADYWEAIDNKFQEAKQLVFK